MRVQVLSLPDEQVNGNYVNRFALVVDEHPEVPDADARKQVAEDWTEFAREIGGKGAFVTPARVEVVEDTATAGMVTEIVRQLDELIGRRINEHTAARTDVHYHAQAPNLTEHLRTLGERARRRREL
ncbi:hypothetical protein [Micromonospora sp. RV43]|uniref:hypothetical protein n=1 Tax=Micromonospora sp. RV43 TaxID=1661387 RepID=UPI00064B935F|nr:hypothetical protein [Micromonospora sp. RV43]